MGYTQEHKDYDAFISYRHETGFYMAHIIYSKLIANGYNVFMDKNMDSGRYKDMIHDAILHSRNFIMILFPDDAADLSNKESWLNIEAGWTQENPTITIIPVMCDKFTWPKDSELPESMLNVKQSNGTVIHKDSSLDRDLDNLCDNFLRNANPSKPKISEIDFFKYNLTKKPNLSVAGVDVAFHAGTPWLVPGEQRELMLNSMKNGIPWRVLINTVDAAESIGKHMRDETALYIPFEQVNNYWKKAAETLPLLEVRECKIPLIHIYHAVKFVNDENGNSYGEQHIKYYAYNNTRLDNAFEHQVSSFSKHYSIYAEEFEFLWNQSTEI